MKRNWEWTFHFYLRIKNFLHCWNMSNRIFHLITVVKLGESKGLGIELNIIEITLKTNLDNTAIGLLCYITLIDNSVFWMNVQVWDISITFKLRTDNPSCKYSWLQSSNRYHINTGNWATVGHPMLLCRFILGKSDYRAIIFWTKMTLHVLYLWSAYKIFFRAVRVVFMSATDLSVCYEKKFKGVT